jgi:adenylate cyclase
VVIGLGTPAERSIPIADRLFVGRECTGVDDAHRLIVDDPLVSRHHLEIRHEEAEARVWVVDQSSNGTRLNGVRLERAVPVTLADGDRILFGETEMLFRSDVDMRERPINATARTTTVASTLGLRALVVGDVVGYTTIAQAAQGSDLVQAMSHLFGELRILLRAQQGTLADVPGDAFFAYWDLQDGISVAHAVEFALLANQQVRQIAPTLSLRNPDGTPIEMGWAVVVGEVAVSPGGVSVLGDATNLAFRLSGLAGRDGHPRVLVTQRAREMVGDSFAFGLVMDLAVKGRSGTEPVVGADFASSTR